MSRFMNNLSLSLVSCLLGVGLMFGPSVARAQVGLEVEDHDGKRSSEVEIPIRVHDARQLGPVQFEITFDPAVLEALGVEAGDMLDGAAASFVPTPGQMNVGTITNAALSGDGELVRARFRVKGGTGDETAIRVHNALAYEYGRLVDLWVDTGDGSFRVTGLPVWVVWLAIAALILLAAWLVLRRRRKSRPQPPGVAVASVSSSEAARFCRQCGNAALATDRFCGGCGQSLSGQ